MNDLASVKDRQPQSHHQRIGRVLCEDAQCGRAVVGDLDRESGFNQDVVEFHALRLVTDGEQDAGRLCHAVGVELGEILSIDARRVASRRFASLELRVRNYFFGGRITLGDVPEGVVVKRMQCFGAERVRFNDILVEARFSVQIANDGAAALGILAQDPPDALVVGLRLPILDGRQVVHAARTVVGLVDIPIIVIAPAGTEQETSDLLSQGVDDVLHEPIDPGKFRSRVTAVMRGRGLWAETEEVMRPLIPQDEAERLIEFRLSAAVESDPEERFDKISRMAQRVFKVPFAGISFVEDERQWFKSKVGLPIPDSARDMSFCGHAITSDQVLVVEDAALDPRFAQNPIVLEDPHIRFYAGQPVKGPGGHNVGTLCIMDKVPREFSEEDLSTLSDLGEMVEKEFKAEPKKGKKKVVAPPD